MGRSLEGEGEGEREEEEEEEDEERLFQMVHDFIESDQSSSASLSSKCLSLHHHHHQSTSLSLQEILRSGSTEEAEREVRASVMKHMNNMTMMRSYSNKKEAEKSTCDLKKWLVLRLQMDGFHASLCQTSWVTSFGCSAGDYEYINIMINNKDDEETERLILDIDFRSQFELARPTPTYKELIDTLPSIFVGTEDKLHKIISLLCSSAKQSLKQRGLHIPPWRTSTYMHSKWLSVPSNNNDNNCKNGNGFSREVKLGNFSKWAPPNPIVKAKSKNLSGGSGLSSQFSNMSINCC